MRLPLLATAAAIAGLALIPTSATAQRRPPTPEQRIDRLEYQVRQVQKSVFPKGRPADTAGFVDDPAATQEAVTALGSRLDSIERQIADLTRASEENGNRLATMEAELARLRADQDRRLRASESGSGDDPARDSDAPAADVPVESDDISPPRPFRPRVETPRPTATLDGAEAAYDAGFRLWEAKKYDSAIASLRKMIAAYPDDRRVSWANNLIGRSLLDKGQYRLAAEALLANYRG
ncbi:MAG: hypothetical protein LH610_03695, partial [Sphingomonas bacterium]|nr:hypothetical protein [Sphingomonas bacterium]